jgi:hypothetical protein
MNPQLTAFGPIELAIAVVLLIVIFACVYIQRRRMATALRQRFGTEYERAVSQHGSERKAQEKLLDREKRVEKLNIRELEPADRQRFVEEWKNVQAHFVDSPAEAVTQADALVTSLMKRRGYPVSDFEQRAADISVDHPHVTENYRAANAIALRRAKSEVGTEDLRTAMIHYRALFDELVHETAAAKQEAA